MRICLEENCLLKNRGDGGTRAKVPDLDEGITSGKDYFSWQLLRNCWARLRQCRQEWARLSDLDKNILVLAVAAQLLTTGKIEKS